MATTREIVDAWLKDRKIKGWSMMDRQFLIETFDEALREREPLWQPIETAPKDGTEIVALGPIFYNWNKDGSPDISERLYACISRYYAEGWYFGAPGIQTSIYPILWTPLPDAAIRRNQEGDTSVKQFSSSPNR